VELRTYGQYCSIARAAEILATRWTPIIVRNLLLGCETFSEIREGAPGIPKTLLIERLRLLERYGIIERRRGSGTRGWRYCLTEAGRELQGITDAMDAWGRRWLEVAPHHLDAHVVLWGICKLLRPEELPAQRMVVRFDITDAPRHRFWIVARRPKAEVCVKPPGFDDDVIVTTDSETLAFWHMGRISLGHAMHAGRMDVRGPRHLVRELSDWGSRAA
jgi:DNA-binding HxlR family transcriptional regulator